MINNVFWNWIYFPSHETRQGWHYMCENVESVGEVINSLTET